MITSAPQIRNEIALSVGFSIQLRQHFDGLTSREKVVEWHPRYTCHFCVVDETHEFVHKALRQIRILGPIFVSQRSQGKDGGTGTFKQYTANRLLDSGVPFWSSVMME